MLTVNMYTNNHLTNVMLIRSLTLASHLILLLDLAALLVLNYIR